jgi:DNA-binding winged helix-turn-helix (wHTH) protein
VEPSLNRLSREGKSVPLAPKMMDVLTYLAGRAGRVVSREELIDAVWAKQFVAESALSRAIAELRHTLQDDAHEPRFIETITKRGYRVIAPVERIEPAPEAARVPHGPGGARAPEPDHDRTPRAVPARVETEGCALRWKDRRIPLAEGENLIGRDPDVLVRIGSRAVSRRHARIVLSGGHAVLEDLGSKNGTYVCGQRITTPCALTDGDTICLGPAELIFLDSIPAGSTRTDLKR